MARAEFIKAARKDIYVNGKQVQYVSQKGKRQGQTLTKVDKTIPADEDDKILIAKGESYYKWAFQYGPTYYSKTRPRPSQLTQSDFLQRVYGLKEEIEDLSKTVFESSESLEDTLNEFKERIEEIRDECQEKLDNMPEQLQYAPSGELLQERIDALDEAHSELDNIYFDYEAPDENDIRKELAEDAGVDTEEDGWEQSVSDEEVEDKISEQLQEYLDEKIEEIQGVDINC